MDSFFGFDLPYYFQAYNILLLVELPQAINIEGLSLDKFLEHQVANSGWVIEKGHGKSQLIVLPRNEFNDPALKKNTADSVPLEHITRIFPILGWHFCGCLLIFFGGRFFLLWSNILQSLFPLDDYSGQLFLLVIKN